MRSLPHIFTHSGAAVLILALSILSGCNDRNVVAPPVVDPGGGPSTTVEVPFCADEAPAWVAFQDGDGAWTRSSPTVDHRHAVYRHDFVANRGGIAVGQRFSIGLTTLNVSYGAPAELSAFGNTFPGECDSSGPKALLGTAMSVIERAPALRLRAVIPPQTVYDRFASIVYQQGANTMVSVGMTAQYASLSNRGYDLSIPDFSGVTGFDPQWALKADATGGVFWTETRIGGTLGFGANVVPTDGAFSRSSTRNGTFTP